MVANILPVDPLRTLRMGSIGNNSTILEHDHVAYLIKGNHEMQHHRSKYFACRPLPDPCPCFWGQNVKIKLFQNMVMLNIKLKRIINTATW